MEALPLFSEVPSCCQDQLAPRLPARPSALRPSRVFINWFVFFACVFEATVWTESLFVPACLCREEAAVAARGVVAGGFSWWPSVRGGGLTVPSALGAPVGALYCVHRSSHSFGFQWSHFVLLNVFYFVWKHFEK